jgi:hypothetical protein
MVFRVIIDIYRENHMMDINMSCDQNAYLRMLRQVMHTHLQAFKDYVALISVLWRAVFVILLCSNKF